MPDEWTTRFTEPNLLGPSVVRLSDCRNGLLHILRHCPITHESYVLVAHTVFSKTTDPDRLKGIKPVHVEGKLLEVTLEAKLVKTNKKEKEEFKKNDGYVNGLSDYELIMQQHVSIDRSHMARLAHAEGNHITIGLQVQLAN